MIWNLPLNRSEALQSFFRQDAGGWTGCHPVNPVHPVVRFFDQEDKRGMASNTFNRRERRNAETSLFYDFFVLYVFFVVKSARI